MSNTPVTDVQPVRLASRFASCVLRLASPPSPEWHPILLTTTTIDRGCIGENEGQPQSGIVRRPVQSLFSFLGPPNEAVQTGSESSHDRERTGVITYRHGIRGRGIGVFPHSLFVDRKPGLDACSVPLTLPCFLRRLHPPLRVCISPKTDVLRILTNSRTS